MREIRIYHPAELKLEESLQLDKQASKHLSQVLKIKPGEPVTLFNGDGNNYICSVQEAGKTTLLIVQDCVQNNSESPLKIHLIQAVSRGERMDFTLQKAVELGVDSITPVFSSRSVVKLTEQRLERKMQHWKGVIISACEQSGRSVIPQLYPAMTLRKYFQDTPALEHNGVILDPYAKTTLNQRVNDNTAISTLIGPEGGFSELETAQAATHGFHPVTLGPRILRTETAGLALISILQSRWGDLF